MASITLRIDKGSPLTNNELDDNFRQLNLLKVELGGDLGGGTGAPVVTSLRGNAVGAATPTTGQTLTWSGTNWIPITPTQVNITSTVTSVVTSTVNNTVTSTVTSTAATVVSSTTTTFPIFGAYASNSELQTFTSGTAQKVKFQTEEYDSANCYDTTTSRFTPNVAGYYQINAEIRFDGIMGTADELLVAIYKNGIEYRRGYNSSGVSPNSANKWFAMQVSTMVYANGTTDYFEIWAQHGNSSNITITGISNTNITYWNGFYVPYQLITDVAASTTVSSAVASAANNAVSSVVTLTTVPGLGNVITVLDDISNQFNNIDRIFTLKNDSVAIVEGVDYTDNKDFTISIGARSYRPAVPQTSTLGPWIVDYTAERTYTYKVTGNRIIFYRGIESRQSADIRINNKSTIRQTRKRYPFSANSIVLGD